ncbi:MAG: branched-chain amino acid ABC transporter permease [Methylobacteriaceae bacterium]|nr:branched-chain amino acid ABC transporter permease [Methylobacteriaceae bacterium]MBV9244678.1 branched-chain amino acid ABC transporter permease [Methylobacteriaceae bacterium]
MIEEASAPPSPRWHSRLPPAAWLALVIIAALALLAGVKGAVEAGQATINGLVDAGYVALGAVGLTLIFGILRIINFAHGDFLTLGAYVALMIAASGLPIWLAAALAILVTAAVAAALDKLVWEPMRRMQTSTLQLLLAAIGIALVLRYTIQFFAGSQVRSFGQDILSAVNLGPWHLGTLQLVALLAGIALIVAVGLGLRFTAVGKQMRALSDNMALAEVTGIDTRGAIRLTWIVAGALAAIAGILYAAAVGTINPNFGSLILLSLFTAAVLGGIGNAYGALLGGIVIGLAQEWSTLFLNARWKPAVGFAILILTLLVLPRGIFGRVPART